MAYLTEEMDMIIRMAMSMQVVQRIPNRNIIHCNAMNDIGLQQGLHGAVKRNAVVQIGKNG